MQNRPMGPAGQGPASFIESSEYLRKGYLDTRGNIRPELLTSEAQQVATELARGELKNAQLRRFFTKIRFIESRLNAGIPFEDLRAEIVGLCPAAADAVNRKVAPRVFRTFVEKNVELAQRDERNFRKGMVQHFQSIVCYFPREPGR